MASSRPGKPSRLLISRSAAEERLQGMGTKRPFEKVVEEHGGTVLRVCRVLLANHDADDAWSETFLAAITAYPGLPETANVEAWPGASELGGSSMSIPVRTPKSRRVTDPWRHRVDSGDWDAVTAEVNEYGGALLPQLLTGAETARIRSLYKDSQYFRATVNMGRHRFGEGEYRYFRVPYPEPVERLKQALYPRLLPIARDWHAKLGRPAPWPDTLDEWLRMCHDAGQDKPTAILLRYVQGDWNALHRDLYGDLVFPLQVVINLSEPGVDHSGGEFLLLEQRPRAQSRGTATLLPHGHGYLFTTRDRPVRSARGWSAAPVRHGVSAIRSGQRHTLALVFHDAA